MIPILYEEKETAFTSNGLGRLRDCISCEVTEERNGIYECEFRYPVDGANYEDIQCGRIIGVIHDDSEDVQPFDIVSYSRPIDGVVTFHAAHISYRLTGYTAKGMNISDLEQALAFLSNSTPPMPFTFESNFNAFGYMSAADGIPRTVRQLLGGIQGSILDTYGGEFEWDRFRVMLKKARGELKDFNIRYGLNMVKYEEEADFLGTYNQAAPYWTDGTNTIYGDVVSSGSPTYTGRDICMPLDLSDKFETAPAKADLEAKALQYMQNNQTHLPRQNIKVDFVRLQDTGEYEQFENLLECNLCDSIGVIFPRYGMQGTFKIVRVVYDVLAERYKEMELGALSVSLSEALGIQNGQSQGLSASNPEDYIVEEGTSGIWTYRKWASGIAECWATPSRSDITWADYGTPTGGYHLYYSASWNIAFPFELLNPCSIVANVRYCGGNIGWCANANYSSSSQMSLTVVRNGNTGNVIVNIFVIGRWK